MSTTKIIAGGVAAVVLIFALTFAVVHKLHSASPAPNVALMWQAPPATDPATQQAEQQIKSQLDQMTSAMLAGNAQRVMAVYSPSLAIDGNSNGKPMRLTYAEWAGAMSDMASCPYKIVRLAVISCSIAGNTATVEVTGKFNGENDPGLYQRDLHRADSHLVYTFVNTGGQWLVTNVR
jgi:hypothetical protein